MSLGVDGLKAVAETAILNNNYMMKRVLNEVRGISMSWAEEAPNRLEQVRYSFETLLQETGVDEPPYAGFRIPEIFPEPSSADRTGAIYAGAYGVLFKG